MDLGNFLGGISTVDLLIFVYFIAFFVLGFAQGTIRRLIGIASIMFSFLFAANIAQPLGEYLGNNWTQFSKEYSVMIAFATVFLASSIAWLASTVVNALSVELRAAIRSRASGTVTGSDAINRP